MKEFCVFLMWKYHKSIISAGKETVVDCVQNFKIYVCMCVLQNHVTVLGGRETETEGERWMEIDLQYITTWTGKIYIKPLFAAFLRSDSETIGLERGTKETSAYL